MFLISGAIKRPSAYIGLVGAVAADMQLDSRRVRFHPPAPVVDSEQREPSDTVKQLEDAFFDAMKNTICTRTTVQGELQLSRSYDVLTPACSPSICPASAAH